MSLTLELAGSGSRADRGGHHSQDYRTTLSSHTTTQEPSRNNWFEGGLPTPPKTKEMAGLSIPRSYSTHPGVQSYSIGYNTTEPVARQSRIPAAAYLTNHLAPSTTIESVSAEQPQAHSIASHLQIPESVNSSKGSLAEFAAEITCLFWFESAATLQYAESLPIDVFPDRGLVPDAIPSFGFRKWVTTMLSTTQVGKNVILLALMFVYRLKKFNPSVSGKRGSEFRLLTIALMLGNKFLDDNTYTNKTWAEVSGISVQEIHIMEVEFLSNMRYELYASQAEWARWKALLGKFGAFYEKASRQTSHPSPNSNPPITPTNQTFAYRLPSPPSKQHDSGLPGYSTLPESTASVPHISRSPTRQLAHAAMPYDRKRSLEMPDILPPAKRFHQASISKEINSVYASSSPYPGSEASTPLAGNQITGSRIPHLPMPRLTTNAGPAIGSTIPPLSVPNTRSMASVYPVTSTAWSHPSTPLSALPPNMTGQLHSSQPPSTVNTRSMGGVPSAHTSPINLYGPATPTRPGLSPSYFLTNRSSPYRPVRNVHTLLIPPPSAAMQNSVRNIAFDQIHYQPLGRPVSDRRTGPVPYHQMDGRQPDPIPISMDAHYRTS